MTVVRKKTVKRAASKKTATKKVAVKKVAAKKVAVKQAAAKKAPSATADASKLIDGRIQELGDWRGKTLAQVRKVIQSAVPDVVEAWKWRGVPCWSHEGLICTGESYKAVVKLTFAHGAALEDPAKLFNASLEGSTRRAIDLREGDKVNVPALKQLIRAAVAFNVRKKSKR